jgi:ribosomal protein L19
MAPGLWTWGLNVSVWFQMNFESGATIFDGLILDSRERCANFSWVLWSKIVGKVALECQIGIFSPWRFVVWGFGL